MAATGKFCVSLTYAKDNPDKATVAFVVANAAVASSQQTLVFLSTEAVRLSQKGYADDIREEGFAPLKELMENFAKAGGMIYVCSPCLKKRKLDENNLVAGATIVGGAKLVEFLADGTPGSVTSVDSLPCEAGRAGRGNALQPGRKGFARRRELALRYPRSEHAHATPRTAPIAQRSPSTHADVSFDGGDMDCGSGLLLMIRSHIDPLPRGGLLEILSTEISVKEDLPAWCRLTGNELVSVRRADGSTRSWSARARCRSADRKVTPEPQAAHAHARRRSAGPLERLPDPAPAPAIAPLAVMGIGSWPRPRWMLQAMHEHLERRLSEAEFQSTADDAVRLAVEAQLRAGVDVVTDGEQRRDSYASFVGGLLDNCQLIPLTDLLPLVDDPEAVRTGVARARCAGGGGPTPGGVRAAGPQPAARGARAGILEHADGQAGRRSRCRDRICSRAACGWSASRTMRTPRASTSRVDIVRVLREEVACLLAAGAAMVQLDEPVLSEVVFTGAKHAAQLHVRRAVREERSRLRARVRPRSDQRSGRGFSARAAGSAHVPRQLDAGRVHVLVGRATRRSRRRCAKIRVGTYLLELCTPRAGDIEALASPAR